MSGGYGNGGRDQDGGYEAYCQDRDRASRGKSGPAPKRVIACARCGDTGRVGLEVRGAGVRAVTCDCDVGKRLAVWLGRSKV